MTHDAALRGKRILVTGGTTGIGRATVEMLAQAGARILTFGRRQESLQQVLDATSTRLGEVHGLTADSSTREGIEQVFATLDDKLGGIDMLVACAALGAEPVHEMAEDDWRYVVETNLIGYMACARAAIERMEAQGEGLLLFVGSISTEIKKPGESVYSATKAGIQAFAETLRKEVAEKNIRVSVIQPGSTSTPMQQCSDDEKAEALEDEEMLTAEDVAETILFALSRPSRVDIVNLRIEPRVQKTH